MANTYLTTTVATEGGVLIVQAVKYNADKTKACYVNEVVSSVRPRWELAKRKALKRLRAMPFKER